MEMRDVDLTTDLLHLQTATPLSAAPFLFPAKNNDFTGHQERHCTNYELSIKGTSICI